MQPLNNGVTADPGDTAGETGKGSQGQWRHLKLCHQVRHADCWGMQALSLHVTIALNVQGLNHVRRNCHVRKHSPILWWQYISCDTFTHSLKCALYLSILAWLFLKSEPESNKLSSMTLPVVVRKGEVNLGESQSQCSTGERAMFTPNVRAVWSPICHPHHCDWHWSDCLHLVLSS